MPLYNAPNAAVDTPEQKLANEARARLTELGNAMLLTYGNLLNYQHNNGAGVTSKQFIAALGKDAKDFKYVMGAVKNILLRLHPDMKGQLDSIHPKNAKKPAA